MTPLFFTLSELLFSLHLNILLLLLLLFTLGSAVWAKHMGDRLIAAPCDISWSSRIHFQDGLTHKSLCWLLAGSLGGAVGRKMLFSFTRPLHVARSGFSRCGSLRVIRLCASQLTSKHEVEAAGPSYGLTQNWHKVTCATHSTD